MLSWSLLVRTSKSFTPARVLTGSHPMRRPTPLLTQTTAATGKGTLPVGAPSFSSRRYAASSSSSTAAAADAAPADAAKDLKEEEKVDDDVKSMRAGDIKKELESYGISTVSFVEKSELVEALQEARAQGLKPKADTSSSSADSGSKKKKRRPSSSSSSSSSKSDDDEPEDTRPREERMAEEMTKCNAMKAGELKKELEGLGISTKSFFEKTDFVKALAEARVDGVGQEKEGYAEYTNVEVLTDDASGPRKRQDDSQQQSQSQRPQTGSPFGGTGGASPFGGGGMGGMGGIADMLKNMNMGAPSGAAATGGSSPFGGGANPFGGMGGMGGNAMGKAQEMMKNPKVMELVMKAQGNPKIMAAMQDCMSNPAAFAKYQNDPEVSELVNELKKYI